MDLMPPVNNAEKAANESGLWTKFSNYLGSDNFANFGKGMQGVGALTSIGTNIYGIFQSLKNAKKSLSKCRKTTSHRKRKIR